MSENRGTLIIGISIASLALAFIFVVLRTFTRTVLRRNLFGWDDALIIIAWLFALSYSIAIWIAVSHGYGRHGNTFTALELQNAIRATVIGQVFAVMSFPPGKASVAILLAKIFPDRRLHWIMGVVVALNAVVFYLDAIFILVRCDPVWKQWTPAFQDGSCWDAVPYTNYNTFVGSVGCASDFFFSAVPWLYMPRLQMNARQMVGVGCALSAGVFAGCCSVVKTYYTKGLIDRTDFAWDTIPLVLLSMSELCLITMGACIPTLTPFYKYITGKDRGPRNSTPRPPQNHIARQQQMRRNAGMIFGVKSNTRSYIRGANGPRQLPAEDSILVETTFSVQHGERSDRSVGMSTLASDGA